MSSTTDTIRTFTIHSIAGQHPAGAFDDHGDPAVVLADLGIEWLNLLDHVAREYRYSSNALKETAARLAEAMDKVVRFVDTEMHVNSLGEVQGRGFDVDRLCAERQERAQMFRFVLNSALRAAGKI